MLVFRIRLFVHNCYAVRIRQDDVGVGTWKAVWGLWVEQKGARDAALGGASVWRDDLRVVFTLDILHSLSQKVQQPIKQHCLESQSPSSHTNSLYTVCWAGVQMFHPNIVLLFSRCSGLRKRAVEIRSSVEIRPSVERSGWYPTWTRPNDGRSFETVWFGTRLSKRLILVEVTKSYQSM